MNIVSVVAGTSALFIPLAVLYRVLNPAEVSPSKVVPSGVPYVPGLNYCHLFKKTPPAPSKTPEQAALESAVETVGRVLMSAILIPLGIVLLIASLGLLIWGFTFFGFFGLIVAGFSFLIFCAGFSAIWTGLGLNK